MHHFFGSDNSSLSYGPHKQVIVVKFTDNYKSNTLHESHGFKEEVKIKYGSVKTIARNFPSRTAVMMALLKT